MQRRYKLPLYFLAVFIAAWIPESHAGGVSGVLIGILVVAGVVGGLIWALA